MENNNSQYYKGGFGTFGASTKSSNVFLQSVDFRDLQIFCLSILLYSYKAKQSKAYEMKEST